MAMSRLVPEALLYYLQLIDTNMFNYHNVVDLIPIKFTTKCIAVLSNVLRHFQKMTLFCADSE